MKPNLKILVFDRPGKDGENVVKDIFERYGWNYDIIIFPPKEGDELVIQCVSYKSDLRQAFSVIFNQEIDYEFEEDDFYDFDIYEIQLDVFYDMLAQGFEIKFINLTTIEND